MSGRAVQGFWSHVRKTTRCWDWVGDRNDHGYGRTYAFGRRARLAHRASWELAHGAIPDGLCILHRCDNPRCVRPGHLFLGTREDNAHDRDRKGRHVALRGESHPQAKLSADQVREIRQRFGWLMVGKQGRRKTGPPTNGQIGREYGVTHSQISLILRGRKWAHI